MSDTLRERVAMLASASTEKEWRESSDDWCAHWLDTADRILALCNESGLRAALEYYAEPRNYRSPAPDPEWPEPMMDDRYDGKGPGARARAALQSPPAPAPTMKDLDRVMESTLRAAKGLPPKTPAPQAEESGWISVEERMPEEGKEVLVYSKPNDHTFFDLAYYEVADPPDDTSVAWFASWSSSEITDVTHWMPLPEPPKGVPNENG